ncbi:MAG: hypothetical protein GY874_11575 [Desulfobacteraceae bacterium]|nr:hypothetical protein [Desulfobacteraceae bacterium]
MVMDGRGHGVGVFRTDFLGGKIFVVERWLKIRFCLSVQNYEYASQKYKITYKARADLRPITYPMHPNVRSKSSGKRSESHDKKRSGVCFSTISSLEIANRSRTTIKNTRRYPK